MICEYPIFLKTVQGIVGCGRCLSCRINLQRKKHFRLMLEWLSHKESCWLTITYNDHFKPMDNSLHPDHMTLFLKRLRKKVKKPIRYFYCGEYGDQTQRPHFHVCLFGIGKHWIDTIRSCWTDPVSKLAMGHIMVVDLSPENMKYTCGYTLKKMTKSDDTRLNGRHPEFARQSMGIGKFSVAKIAKAFKCRSLSEYYKTYRDIPRSFNMDGKEYPMDRYTRQKILEHLEIAEETNAYTLSQYKKKMLSLPTDLLKTLPKGSSLPSLEMMQTYKHYVDNGQKIKNAVNRQKILLSAKEKKV